MAARHQEAELEQSRPEVDERTPVTLSEAVRMFLDFIADEALRQVMTDTANATDDGPRDAADGDVPGGPHERRPHR